MRHIILMALLTFALGAAWLAGEWAAGWVF